MTTDSEYVLRAENGGVLRLTLNQPQRRNCLSEAMMQALQNAITDASNDPAIKVLIIAASGKVFSSGHDLKELNGHRQDADKGREYFHWLMTKCATLMQAIVTCPKPIIGEVAGIATAAGCQLIASCDLAVAGAQAQFATPGVNIGLFCSTPMVALSRNVSHKHAMEMLLTGTMISAQRAEQIGLVNKVVAADELSTVTDELAQHIASKSALVLKTGKQAFYTQSEMGLAAAYNHCADVMVENMLFKDAQEGIDAFIEKRPARWQDK